MSCRVMKRMRKRSTFAARHPRYGGLRPCRNGLYLITSNRHPWVLGYSTELRTAYGGSGCTAPICSRFLNIPARRRQAPFTLCFLAHYIFLLFWAGFLDRPFKRDKLMCIYCGCARFACTVLKTG